MEVGLVTLGLLIPGVLLIPPVAPVGPRSVAAPLSVAGSNQSSSCGLGEVAGALNFVVPIGGNETLQWIIASFSCTANLSVQLQPSDLNGTVPNTSAPQIWLTVPGVAGAATPSHYLNLSLPPGGINVYVNVTIQVPDNLSDVGVNWGTHYLGCPEVLPPVNGSGGIVVPGVAKAFTVTAFNPAAPYPVVGLATNTTGVVATGASVSISNGTRVPVRSGGVFAPVVVVTPLDYGAGAPPVLLNVTWSNAYGLGNGSLNVTQDGRMIFHLPLTSFGGSTYLTHSVRLAPGLNTFEANLTLGNAEGTLSVTGTTSVNYTTSLLSGLIRLRMNSSVSPTTVPALRWTVEAANGSALANGTITPRMHSGSFLEYLGPPVAYGETLLFEGAVRLTAVGVGTFELVVLFQTGDAPGLARASAVYPVP